MEKSTNYIPTVLALAIMVAPILSRASEAAEPDTVGPGVLSAKIMESLKILDSKHVFLSFRHRHYEDANIICYLNNPRASASAHLIHLCRM